MKAWKSGLVVFLSGVLLGALGMHFLVRPGDLPSPDIALSPGAAPEPADPHLVRDLQARLDDQSEEISRLRNQISLMETTPPTPSPGETPPPEVESEPQPRPRRGYSGYISRRVDQMVESLGLNDSQREQLETVFQNQMEAMRARRHGEAVDPFNLDEALAGVLTQEQLDAYIESSQQEIYNRAELIATTQMVRLNQVVGLEPEQMDQVYDAINYTAQEMMISRQTGEAYNMGQILQERLAAILTEEQMTQFREKGQVDGIRMGPGAFGP